MPRPCLAATWPHTTRADGPRRNPTRFDRPGAGFTADRRPEFAGWPAGGPQSRQQAERRPRPSTRTWTCCAASRPPPAVLGAAAPCVRPGATLHGTLMNLRLCLKVLAMPACCLARPRFATPGARSGRRRGLATSPGRYSGNGHGGVGPTRARGRGREEQVFRPAAARERREPLFLLIIMYLPAPPRPGPGAHYGRAKTPNPGGRVRNL